MNDLQEVLHHLRHVAVAGAQHSENQHDPKQIERYDDKAGQRQEKVPCRHTPDGQEDERIYEKVVAKNDGVAVERPQYMGEQRHAHLKDDALGADKGGASLADRRRNEAPEDQADANVGKKLLHRRTEECAEDEPERADQNTHVDGQPKRSDPRAPVTLGHVLPAESRRQVMFLQRGADVGDGLSKEADSCFQHKYGHVPNIPARSRRFATASIYFCRL